MKMSLSTSVFTSQTSDAMGCNHLVCCQWAWYVVNGHSLLIQNLMPFLKWFSKVVLVLT